ncbi:MAG: UDP-glucose 4-epimerase [Fimbriimonadaceae bacterium]|nr:UDP-glucose 4-epimerase [Fimbriimonadaceae bacterium]
MAKYLVTGGAGFIGSHLTDRLVADGHDVVVVDDLSSGYRENLRQVDGKVQFVKGSIEDAALLAENARGCAGLFHLAAVVSVQDSIHDPIRAERVNALSTLHVLEAARQAGAAVVLSSSAAVYGDDPALPKTEGMPTEPISPYGEQKLHGERLLAIYGRLHGLRGTALRYFNVYGPRQDPKSPYSGVISIFIDRCRRGDGITIFGDGEQTRDFVYVADVVAANLAAMNAATADAKSYNIGTGRSVSLNHLVEAVQSALGSSVAVSYGEARTGDIRFSSASVERAQLELGWQAAVRLDQGLTQTVG